MSLTQLVSTEFQVITCYRCAVQFAMTKPLYERLREDHDHFWCPSGHQQHFIAKSDLTIAREELAKQKQLRDQAEAAAVQARGERDAAERKAKRLKHRVSGGACPCCKRSFVALARHMATKHPGFVKDAKP